MAHYRPLICLGPKQKITLSWAYADWGAYLEPKIAKINDKIIPMPMMIIAPGASAIDPGASATVGPCIKGAGVGARPALTCHWALGLRGFVGPLRGDLTIKMCNLFFRHFAVVGRCRIGKNRIKK